MTRPLDLADELAQLVNPLPQQDLDPEAAGLGDGDLLNAAPLDPQLEALLGDAGATAGAASAGRRRGVAADIALDGSEYRGRVSSRAALFGNGDDAGSSSDGEGGSSEAEDDDEEEQQQQHDVQERGRPQFTSPSRLRVVAVSPDRDLSRYKTMFVNGHHHPGAPGKDDTTDDSSSTDSDSDDNQQQDEQQLMNGHHHDQQELQAQQQEHVRIEHHQQQQDRQVSPAPLQQQHQQHQQQQASPAVGSGSGEESAEAEQPPSIIGEQQQQPQQQRHAAATAAAAEVSSDGGEGSEEDEESEEGSEDIEQQDEQQRLAGQQSDGSEGSEGEGEEDDSESGSEQGDEDADKADGMDVDAPAAAAAAAAAVVDGDGEADRVAAAAAAAAMLGEAAEMQELEREAAAVRAEAEQQLVAAAAGGDRQAAKAAGVRAQQRLWGNALELRIRLQKAVNGANRLPRPAAAAAFQSSNSQVAESYKQLQAACRDTLEIMLQLHDALAQQHPAAAAALAAAAAAKQQQEQQPAATAAGSKRSRAAAGVDGLDRSEPVRKDNGVCSSATAAWSAVEGAIESMAGFRDASLDKWHRRTVLSSGTAALRGSSGLRALQQSISTQVSQLMSADRAKLIARSQLPVQLAPRPLGQPAPAADGQQQQDGGDDEGGGARGSERARDAETYDEGDFYSQLLKELLESAPAGSVPSQLASARPAKRRKVVDRRASKGRKLRFHTMDKLVGFMAPKDMVLPPFAEQLFGNLFSHEG